ncbi:Iron-sulfur cluster carrier protein [Methylobacterium tardum]|jgi:pilus assembly protein CpaE|uniref:Pilus assembly protein n=1 Tax=Methylobacterium tardum TaxID=374432 RepID=A0AA37TCL6_9HYPH|nr:AAA family ATPase [Methylobacterium tardum]URD35339.1 AAA family ATPase [Methylobacterium tardum]GJE51342.1 Iron-sulfur cluster carrier protein [Methylobacterium tardum]GLS68674.1 pilus assembly protein [Methylobacterium tardum]
MADLSETTERTIAPVPRITIQAFCETSETAAMIEGAALDRRMQKAQVKVRMGGGAAAIEAYRHAPTPNVIVIETQGVRSKPVECLDALAEVCDEGTRVLVIGHLNDVTLYRQLIQRGVSDYLMAPVEPLTLIAAISDLFTAPGVKPVGRTVAVVGVKGGIGASTVAHNFAWSVARSQGVQTVIADLDIAFGTASLNFNQDPPQGIAEAVFAPERLDSALVERLLSKCSDNLSLLSAPASLDRTIDLSEPAFDALIEYMRASVPCVVLDVPHQWSAWSRRVLTAADEILIVAGPDLACLRNTKNLLGALKHGRPNDQAPRIVLNGVGVPKRPEIGAAEFAKALEAPVALTIPFEPALFGTAANNGQMIAEIQAGSKVAELFNDLAAMTLGRPENRRGRSSLLEPLLAKFASAKFASAVLPGRKAS